MDEVVAMRMAEVSVCASMSRREEDLEAQDMAVEDDGGRRNDVDDDDDDDNVEKDVAAKGAIAAAARTTRPSLIIVNKSVCRQTVTVNVD